MATADTDYTPAFRKEIKADAETGRTFKKWKHRAQGAATGGTIAGVAGILAGRALKKRGFSKVPHGTTSMSEVLGMTTDLSLHGGFKDMLESSVKLKKVHAKAWKEMTPKEREANRSELRTHRQAINDQEQAADGSYGSIFSGRVQTTDLDAMGERHPGDLPLDPATLKRKKLNAGQTGPQSPLMPQEPLVRIKVKGVHMSERRSFTNLSTDGNGRPHGGSGQFEPDVDGISSQSIQRAYSPKNRLTGRAPIKSTLRQTIARRALARVGRIATV